jgi:hypothetical protein
VCGLIFTLKVNYKQHDSGIVITFVVKNTKAVGITLLVIGVIAMAITNLWGIMPFALLLPAGIVALRYNPYRQ